MYKGIAASRGIGIGNVCVIVEHDLKFESKKIENIDAEKSALIKRLKNSLLKQLLRQMTSERK